MGEIEKGFINKELKNVMHHFKNEEIEKNKIKLERAKKKQKLNESKLT